MLRVFNRWLTWIVMLAIVAGCAQATPTPTLAPTVEPTPPASPATPSPSPRPPTEVPMATSTATRTPTTRPATQAPTVRPATQAPTATSTPVPATQVPTATSTPVPSPSPRPVTQVPTAARTPGPSPVPTALPTATPDPNPWTGCGHLYFPLEPQAHWRYAITTQRTGEAPTPQAPSDMRVVSIESDAGRTIATLNYASEHSASNNYTFRVDCVHRPAVVCRMIYDPRPNYYYDCTGSDPAATLPRECALALPAEFHLDLPPVDQLVPGYSWNGCSWSHQGSAGGEAYSTAYTVIAAEPVVFQGRQYDGLKIKEVEVSQMLPGIGGVTFYGKITATAEKVYTIELARGVGMVRRVATGEIHCTSDALTAADDEWACWTRSETTNYELLEFGRS